MALEHPPTRMGGTTWTPQDGFVCQKGYGRWCGQRPNNLEVEPRSKEMGSNRRLAGYRDRQPQWTDLGFERYEGVQDGEPLMRVF